MTWKIERRKSGGSGAVLYVPDMACLIRAHLRGKAVCFSYLWASRYNFQLQLVKDFVEDLP